MIVDCAVYVGGTRDPEHLPLPEAYERARSTPDGFVWIGLLEPTFEEGYDDSLRREDFGLTAVPRLGTYRGLVFASLSASGITLDEHLGQVREYIDLFMDVSPTGRADLCTGVQKLLLLAALDEAIMALDFPRTTAAAKAYLDSGADRRPYMETVALAASDFVTIPGMRPASGR